MKELWGNLKKTSPPTIILTLQLALAVLQATAKAVALRLYKQFLLNLMALPTYPFECHAISPLRLYDNS
ncbi:MAG: hypothetical protein WCS87_11740 [Methylococcaceae bacterium]